MADTVNFLQNGYNGEVLEDLLTYTAQGNDTFREGLIHIKSGIQHKYTLPAIKLGDIIHADEHYGEEHYFTRDGVHPNPCGAEFIANIYVEAISPYFS